MRELKINIKQLRTRLDMKPDEFAKALGITTSELEQMESDWVPTDSKTFDTLRKLYPKVNLHWFIEATGSNDDQPGEAKEHSSSNGSKGHSNESETLVLVREGKHEQAAIQFFQKINKSAWPTVQRIKSTSRFIYLFDERCYLVVATNELEQVAREHVGKCLWMAPDSLLSLFLPESDKKNPILSIASSFRKNYHTYGSVMVPDLYSEAAAFNLFLETMVADKERLINSVLESLTYEQILSTMDHISYEEIVYEAESYRIFDVTL